MDKRRKAFTLIELLITVAVIGILASTVLAVMAGVQNDSRDAAVLSSLSSTQTMVYRCLMKDDSNDIASPDSTGNGNMVCISGTGVPGIGFAATDIWPDISGKGWNNYYTANNFAWCPAGYQGDTHPATGTYAAAHNSSGRFCYLTCNKNCGATPDKWIWCTEKGCKKEGF